MSKDDNLAANSKPIVYNSRQMAPFKLSASVRRSYIDYIQRIREITLKHPVGGFVE